MDQMDLEERIAHLTRSVDELSDEVARQAKALETAEQRIALLMARAAEAEAQATGTVVMT